MLREEDLQPVDIKKQLQDDTVTSARNALATVVQSKQIGADTLSALDAQGKQIDGMQRNVEKILQDQKIAEHKTRSIGSIFGAIMNSIRGEPVITAPPATPSTPPAPPRQRIKIADDPVLPTNPVDETTVILDELSSHLDDLNAMAVQMGTEIDKHNSKLQKLTGTTQQANTNMDKLNQDVTRLIRKM